MCTFRYVEPAATRARGSATLTNVTLYELGVGKEYTDPAFGTDRAAGQFPLWQSHTKGGAAAPKPAEPCRWIAVGVPVMPVREIVTLAGTIMALAFGSVVVVAGTD